MYRPDGWKNGYDTEREEDGMYSRAELFEAGADAMLEGLRKEGLSYEDSLSMPKLAGFIYSRVVGKKGKIVFIPDEIKE